MTTSEPADRIPTGVVRKFRDELVDDELDRTSPMFRVVIDQAAMMARLQAPAGDVIEWWEAPNEAGGTFIYLRQLPADGGDAATAVRCRGPRRSGQGHRARPAARGR